MAKKKQVVASEVPAAAPVEPVITAYKGFDANLRCRGFQYEVGKTYDMDGKIEACRRGFHACEHPLNVLAYYPPNTSRFAVVSLSGKTAREDGGDTKIAAARITIEAEIKLPDLIQRAVDYVFSRAKWSEGPVATAGNEGATASGDQGAATASGDRGAATAEHATSVAMASGWSGKARGVAGAALFLTRRNDDGNITHAWAGIVGNNGIEPNVFYTLGDDGQPVAAE